MSIRNLLSRSLAVLALSAGAAFAQSPFFERLQTPQPTEGGGKVEVVEFFWYGCGHCYQLESHIGKWASNLPADVTFKRIPAVTEGWAQLALMYYTLEAMGQLEKVHLKIFDAIHVNNVNLNAKKFRDEFLQKNGVDMAKYAEVEKSFSVASKMNRARSMTAAYRVDGVPMVVVNGKYRIKAEAGPQLITALNSVIDMARKETKAAEATQPVPPSRKIELVKK